MQRMVDRNERFCSVYWMTVLAICVFAVGLSYGQHGVSSINAHQTLGSNATTWTYVEGHLAPRVITNCPCMRMQITIDVAHNLTFECSGAFRGFVRRTPLFVECEVACRRTAFHCNLFALRNRIQPGGHTPDDDGEPVRFPHGSLLWMLVFMVAVNIIIGAFNVCRAHTLGNARRRR